jgi:bifunctional non-homologous end joining protein LigD
MVATKKLSAYQAERDFTISRPLTRSQVKSGLDPLRYTERTVPGLLTKTKAWTEYSESEQPLAAAIKRLSS